MTPADVILGAAVSWFPKHAGSNVPRQHMSRLSWHGLDGGLISRILSSGEETLQSWHVRVTDGYGDCDCGCGEERIDGHGLQATEHDGRFGDLDRGAPVTVLTWLLEPRANPAPVNLGATTHAISGALVYGARAAVCRILAAPR